uniref:Uncharacterized protein n=1 Tax=Triticum urartu TaxID=4572 RepID=A0A8R7TCG3_TRIUA
VDAAEGAGVRFEDAGDGGGDGWRVGRHGAKVLGFGEKVDVDEDEGRGAPERAPARGERGGARGVLDGEAGEDVAQEVAGEAADAVGAAGGGEGGEPCAVVERVLGEALVDVRQHELRGLLHRVQVGAVASCVGRRRDLLLLGHGLRRCRSMSWRGFVDLGF